MYESVSKRKKIILLTAFFALFFSGFTLGANSYIEILNAIRDAKIIVIYDPDYAFVIPCIYIAILCVINLYTMKEMSEKLKNRILNYSLLAAFVLGIVTPIVVHRHVIASFSEAGYIRCGDFFRQRQMEGIRSLFRKVAWVLDANDCAEAEAYPPRRSR